MEAKEIIENIELNNIPDESTKWKTLEAYRNNWNFLPNSLRHRVSEQLMASDYLISMEIWLKPIATIKERQRIVFLQQLASIYEGVIGEIVEKEINEKKQEDGVFKETFNSARYGSDMTFGPILKLAFQLELLDQHWKSYLDKMREIRNWIHLSNNEKEDVKNWAMNKSCNQHRNKLNKFRGYFRENYE